MGAMVRPLLAPRVRSLKQVPMALLQVALFGAVVGPMIGLFIGWLFLPSVGLPAGWRPLTLREWLLFGARGGMTYSLVFYSVFGLGLHYVRRRYQPSAKMHWVLGFIGWIVALLVLTMILPGGEWFAESVRARSIRIIAITTILFILVGIFRSAFYRVKAEKAAAEARAQVKVLQAEMNPHFFFNTLNTVYALISVDPAAAQRTVGLLADMSRHAFAGAQTDFIPLAQELDFANAYLEIEKVRFGSRLRCEMPSPSTLEGIHVPALTVQPLIENAIRHGIARRIEGGEVSVEVERNGRAFSLTVRNDCDLSIERSALAFFREGHALENIRERLRLYYGDQASIDVSFPRSDVIAVTVTGPIQ
jgi:two-component system, LytTR family, sensor histidine kinase AlgZ